jgi:hypothetical protein
MRTGSPLCFARRSHNFSSSLSIEQYEEAEHNAVV